MSGQTKKLSEYAYSGLRSVTSSWDNTDDKMARAELSSKNFVWSENDDYILKYLQFHMIRFNDGIPKMPYNHLIVILLW
jgi:hypothetical protein